MGDMWAYVYLKDCCLQALQKLDKARAADRQASGATRTSTTSLASTLGPLKIPQAMALVEQLHTSRSDLLHVSTKSGRTAWDRVTSKHHKKHTAAGETREAKLWETLAAPPAWIDLTGEPDVYTKLADRINGKKSFSLGGPADPTGKDLLRRLREAAGNRVDVQERRVLFKIKSLDGGSNIWIGAGQLKTLSGDHPNGVTFEIKNW